MGRAFTCASSPRSTIGCVQNNFWAAFGTNRSHILHQQLHCLQMKRSENSHDPCHLRVSSGASKMTSEPWYVRRKPCTYLTSRLALSLKGPKHAPTWAWSPCGTIRCVQKDLWACGTSSTNHAPILHRHWHCLQTERRDIPHDPFHLRVPLGASKMIFEPLIRSSQTVHLSCVKISNISNDPRFHLNLGTIEYHRVHLKWFLRLWYV
jgi:hypothetical protein